MTIRHMLGPVAGFLDGARIVAGTVQAAAFAAAALASATDLESATDLTKIVTAGMLNRHPGMPKAWVKFTATGSVLAAHNVSTATGITVNGTGDWTVTFITHFSATGNYAVSGTLDQAADLLFHVDSQASNGVRVNSFDISGGGLGEGTLNFIHVVCFGDQ